MMYETYIFDEALWRAYVERFSINGNLVRGNPFVHKSTGMLLELRDGDVITLLEPLLAGAYHDQIQCILWSSYIHAMISSGHIAHYDSTVCPYMLRL